MKKIILFIILFIALFMIKEAEAIVLAPPIIYTAIFSLGAFIMNMCFFIALWLAIAGAINRLYFGKHVYEIARVYFNITGKVVIFIVSAAIAAVILNPLNTKEIISTSLLAGILGLAILFISNFREYRLFSEKQKMSFIKSIVALGLSIIIVTFFSASFTLKNKTLHRDNKFSANCLKIFLPHPVPT